MLYSIPAFLLFCMYNLFMYEWDETKRASNLEKHGLDFVDSHLVYENADKMTLQSPRAAEPRLQDIALVELAGELLPLVSVMRGHAVRIISFRRASRRKGSCMATSKETNKVVSQTDWARVKKESAAETAIPYSPEDGPYDPNDAAAVAACWDQATITHKGKVIRRGRGPQKAPTKQRITIRLSPEVVEHFRASGKGWQNRVDEVLAKVAKSESRVKH